MQDVLKSGDGTAFGSLISGRRDERSPQRREVMLFFFFFFCQKIKFTCTWREDYAHKGRGSDCAAVSKELEKQDKGSSAPYMYECLSAPVISYLIWEQSLTKAELRPRTLGSEDRDGVPSKEHAFCL